MKKVCVHSKDQIIILDISEVCEDVLIDIFIEHSRQAVYVKENSIVIGVITLSNFRRSQLNKGELITRKFTKIPCGDEDKIEKILKEKDWVNFVPVMHEGQIEKEYYLHTDTVKPKRIKNAYDVINQIIYEIRYTWKLEKQEKAVFYVDMLSDTQIAWIKKLVQNENIIITDKMTVSDIEKYASKGINCIHDFCPETYDVWSIFYEKYGMSSIKWEEDGCLEQSYIIERASYFKSIAVFAGQSNYFNDMFKNVKVCYIDEKKFSWDKERNCYVYMGSLDDDVECIFVLAVTFSNPCIILQNRNGIRNVPIIAIRYASLMHEYKSVYYDIVYNIIPKLKKGGIETVIIRNPDREYEKNPNILLTVDMDNRPYWYNLDPKRKSIFLGIGENEYEQMLAEWKGYLTSGMSKGFLQLLGFRGKYMNYFLGERYTVGHPKDASNKIFLFGPCMIHGSFVQDKDTIGSYMQAFVPKHYYVKNCGNHPVGMNFVMRNNKYKTGDIVVMMLLYGEDLCEKEGIKTHSIIQAYKDTHNLSEHVLDMLTHCDKTVAQNVSKRIVDICTETHALKNEVQNYCQKEIEFGTDKMFVSKELEEWLQKTSQKYRVENKKKAGAIVMNCNPFTLGHRYLIEESSRKVDVLYVFVLEEDKSYFDFQSRFHMVNEGVEDLKNVIVIPSGKYIISTQTMPGYFDKENQPFIESDAVTDLQFFAEVIAGEFNISVRFAGEEPKDVFTKQYNEHMRQILPKYGIEFCEIPRKKINDEIISASLVRKYMAEHNYEAIKKLVMSKTYSYLEKNFLN